MSDKIYEELMTDLQTALQLMERIGRKRNYKGQLLRDLPKQRIVEELLTKVILYNPLDLCEIHVKNKTLRHPMFHFAYGTKGMRKFRKST